MTDMYSQVKWVNCPNCREEQVVHGRLVTCIKCKKNFIV